METGGGDDSESGSVKKKKGKQNSTTGIGSSLIPDSRDKQFVTYFVFCVKSNGRRMT